MFIYCAKNISGKLDFFGRYIDSSCIILLAILFYSWYPSFPLDNGRFCFMYKANSYISMNNVSTTSFFRANQQIEISLNGRKKNVCDFCAGNYNESTLIRIGHVIFHRKVWALPPYSHQQAP